jgi:hypothetical protein
VKMLSNKAATVFLVVCLDRFRVEMWLKKVHENINMLNWWYFFVYESANGLSSQP